MTGRPVDACHARTRPYHHGDLRSSLLEAALDVVRADGPSGLSLRDLARRAGVSHAAPAHHFKDRTGLLTAIAVQGYGLLTAALGQAADLRDAAVRYVRFAAEHPAHFQVMFSPDLLRADDGELVAAKGLAGECLRTGVAALPRSAGSVNAQLTTAAAWSLAHGFATLLLSGNLEEALEGLDPGTAILELTEMCLGTAVQPPAPEPACSTHGREPSSRGAQGCPPLAEAEMRPQYPKRGPCSSSCQDVSG